MKIAVFEVEEWERVAFQNLAKEHDIHFFEGELDEENAEQFSDSEIISTFIYSDMDDRVLKKFPNLKLICTRSTGYDHVATDYCKQNDITVCYVPDYGDNTVAEHVFGLLLNISHRLTDAIDRTRRGDFSFRGLRGFDLMDRTLGVIGTGNIGAHTIQIARGFGMKVLANDVNEDHELAEKLGFQYVSKDELLQNSDIITLHVPSNEKTRHMLSHDEFERMQDGVVLINTSRGSLVNTEALVQALARKKVAAAGIDVLAEEPSIREEAELLHSVFHEKHKQESILLDHVLLRMRNVYITPHTAFNTTEAINRILETTIENITSFLEGKPQNVVAGKK